MFYSTVTLLARFLAYLHPVLLPRSRNIRAAAAAPLPDFLQSTHRFAVHIRQNPLSLRSHIFHKLSVPADMRHGFGTPTILLMVFSYSLLCVQHHSITSVPGSIRLIVPCFSSPAHMPLNEYKRSPLISDCPPGKPHNQFPSDKEYIMRTGIFCCKPLQSLLCLPVSY